jgi:hypothetical protein
VRKNQSLQDENSEPENSENEEDLTEITSSAESLTEVQPVGGNLTPSHADSPQQVGVDQTASLHAAENTLVVSADQDDDDDHTNDHFVLMSDQEPNKMTNQQDADNRLISEENNPLILNYPRPKIRHDYKQLHQKDFVKSAKTASTGHRLITPKTFEQAINGPQAKE